MCKYLFIELKKTFLLRCIVYVPGLKGPVSFCLLVFLNIFYVSIAVALLFSPAPEEPRDDGRG